MGERLCASTAEQCIHQAGDRVERGRIRGGSGKGRVASPAKQGRKGEGTGQGRPIGEGDCKGQGNAPPVRVGVERFKLGTVERGRGIPGGVDPLRAGENIFRGSGSGRVGFWQGRNGGENGVERERIYRTKNARVENHQDAPESTRTPDPYGSMFRSRNASWGILCDFSEY